MTNIIDIHTHRLSANHDEAIANRIVGVVQQPASEARYISVGIHPWHISQDPETLISELNTALSDKRVVAIGEAGLDKLCDTPLDVQKDVLLHQIRMSEDRGLPLIIHAVKSHDEILHLHSVYQPRSPWIIHGFRGKPQLAKQYLSKGIYLSFGEHFNAASLAAAYAAGKLLIESDESAIGIDNIYLKVAESLGVGACELKQSVRQNVERLFFDR